mmetsp:Transcript_5100/g.18348  ORF Transcript_5100/g.18348 Transcript_5100/m.18348 type:complete len:265 (+) Transcript_5100:1306-2100(+)
MRYACPSRVQLHHASVLQAEQIWLLSSVRPSTWSQDTAHHRAPAPLLRAAQGMPHPAVACCLLSRFAVPILGVVLHSHAPRGRRTQTQHLGSRGLWKDVWLRQTRRVLRRQQHHARERCKREVGSTEGVADDESLAAVASAHAYLVENGFDSTQALLGLCGSDVQPLHHEAADEGVQDTAHGALYGLHVDGEQPQRQRAVRQELLIAPPPGVRAQFPIEVVDDLADFSSVLLGIQPTPLGECAAELNDLARLNEGGALAIRCVR